jgi:adenosylcobinamide kinase/adenosylcobinamide-phosphate guanylyltransferase
LGRASAAHAAPDSRNNEEHDAMIRDPGATNRRFVLILGGARSGKSSYAESLATRIAHGRTVVYLATAEPGDDELRARIAAHRAGRPSGWLTIEAPRDPAGALLAGQALSTASVVLVDCATVLVSNLLLAEHPSEHGAAEVDMGAAERRVRAAIESLLGAYRTGSASLIVVSNEVGMGVVPPYPLGRAYRDMLGRVNARLAAEADTVLLMVAGLPVELKSLAGEWERSLSRQLGSESEPSL